MGIEQELASIAPQRETLFAIGVFDGVHLGHQYLIDKLKQRAKEQNLLSGVITFSPNPQSVLHPNTQLPQISDLKHRLSSLKELNIDLVAGLTFTPELAQLSAQEFVALLKKCVKLRGLIVGPDFALGRGREGNAQVLRTLGQEMAFTLETVPPFTIDGETVSSTLIRQALAQGDMTKVKKFMGRHFSISAKVVSADKRGRVLGFPTANLDINQGQVLPHDGVYASVTHVDGKQFASASNVGIRPTFGGDDKRTVETYLLNYEGNLYDKELVVGFVDKLRDEQCFTSPQELTAQIEKDIERVRTIIARELK